MPGIARSMVVDDGARRHAADFRAAVEKRAKEKDITLADALREIQAEGQFSAADRERNLTLSRTRSARDVAKGWGRDAFSRAVDAKKQELLSRNPDLSELAAFRQAAEVVARKDSEMLLNYRLDVEILR